MRAKEGCFHDTNQRGTLGQNDKVSMKDVCLEWELKECVMDEKIIIEFEITCINKSPRDDPYEHISHVAGPGFKRISQEMAIGWIESGYCRLFVGQGASRVLVVVATSARGRKYLKTQNDGEEPNNLLSLPECTSNDTDRRP